MTSRTDTSTQAAFMLPAQPVFGEEKSSLQVLQDAPPQLPASRDGGVPLEIISCIFRFLAPEDLGRTSCVCRTWEALASHDSLWNAFDLKQIFPSLSIIDETTWETYAGLQVQDAPPLDKRVAIAVLKRLFVSLPIEGASGMTLLTMPKGFTFNKLRALAPSPQQGHPTNFRLIWSRIPEEFRNIPVAKTYRIAITNSILEDSRGLTFRAQQELVHGYECEMPELLPMATLAILTYISSPELPPTRLYNDNPWTYTRCSEHVDGYPLAVGGFAPAGLIVHSGFDSDYRGVGALRKF